MKGVKFSRSELGPIAIIALSILVYSWLSTHRQMFHHHDPMDTSEFNELIAEFEKIKSQRQISHRQKTFVLLDTSRLDTFNINNIDSQGLLNIGFSSSLAHRYLNYRMKMGETFKSVDQVGRLYGLDSFEQQCLMSFAFIEPNTVKENVETKENRWGSNWIPKTESVTNSKPVSINLNTCDSQELIKLKGIGPYFASKIIGYRKALGGFVDESQLLEIYRFDTATFMEIRPQLVIAEDELMQLQINELNAKELAKHPYISFRLASQIENYRIQHGNYADTTALKQVYLMDSKTLKKLSAYLSFK